MLQNTVPSIMHTSSGEKPQSTPATVKSTADRPTIRKMNAMLSDRRFEFERNIVSSFVSTKPASAPSSSEPTISMSGESKMLARLNCALSIARAIPKDTANAMRPTASSSATIGSSRSVSSPLALYWRTTISVVAGAVAVAIAPSVIAAGTDSTSGRRKWKITSAISTKASAASACKTPIIIACLPVFLSWLRRNSLPMEKAIKPIATSEIMLSASTWS